MINIRNHRQEDWPEGKEGPGPRTAEIKIDGNLPKEGDYTHVDRFAFSRKMSELSGICMALYELPCEAEALITIANGTATTSGSIWMAKGGDTLVVLEETLQDIEAISSHLGDKYPDCKVTIDYKLHQK